jgi:TPR repeat protein
MKGSDANQKERALKTKEELAAQQYPAGMYAWGQDPSFGELVPKDSTKGLDLVTLAAQKRYGPAVYEVRKDVPRRKTARE